MKTTRGRLGAGLVRREKAGRRLATCPCPRRRRVRRGQRRPVRSPDGVGPCTQAEVRAPAAAGVHTGRLVPEYPLTAGLDAAEHARAHRAGGSGKRLRPGARKFCPRTSCALRASLRGDALRQLHFPDDPERLAAARRRLAFEELLVLRLAVGTRRGGLGRPSEAPRCRRPDRWCKRGCESAALCAHGSPAAGHAGNRRATCAGIRPMRTAAAGRRGSGKTLVAAHALLRAVEAGGQAAFWRPAKFWPRQHAPDVPRLVRAAGRRRPLLTGSAPAASGASGSAGRGAGRPVVVVGTHALLGACRPLPAPVGAGGGRAAPFRRAASATRWPCGRAPAALPGRQRDAHSADPGAVPVRRLDVVRSSTSRRRARLPVDTRWVRPHRREEVYDFVRRRGRGGRAGLRRFPVHRRRRTTKTTAGDTEAAGGGGEAGQRHLRGVRSACCTGGSRRKTRRR